jgi:AcrR family transcriptional regulator
MATRARLKSEEILDAAIRIADKTGLDELALSQVAVEVGVKTPSLYEHFEGLPGLRLAIRLRGFQTLGDIIDKATVGKSRDDAVRALALETRRFVHQHPALYESTVLTAVGDSKEVRKAADGVLATLYSVLAGYGITGTEAVHAARYLRSLLHGFNSLELAGGFGLNVHLSESYDRMIVMLAQDLRQWSILRTEPLPQS